MVPEIFSSVGGIPRILQLYLKALCELGAQRETGIKLISLNDPVLDSRDQRRYADAGLADWRVCGRDKRYFVVETLRMSHGCRRVICGHVAQLPVAWIARLINRHQRYFLVAHGIEVWRPFTFLERVALRGATRIFCVSEFTRRELLKRCPLPEGKAIVLPNALDPFFTIENGVPLDEAGPIILTVSRLTYADRYKGVEHLIEAMPLVRAVLPEACLRIVGRGEDMPRLQQLARRAGLLNRGIEFLGVLSDARLAEEMRSCRLFAMPSGKEGFGLVFLEAMAHGRPCLGASAGGIPEVITEDTGILVPFGDLHAIADGCVAGLQRSWNTERILERAREFSYGPFKARLAALLE